MRPPVAQACRVCHLALTQQNWLNGGRPNKRGVRYYICQDCYKAQRQMYRALNKDKIVEANKRWRLKNIERVRENHRRQYQLAPEKVKRQRDEWRKANHERHLQNCRNELLRLKIQVLSHYSPELKCQRCGFSDLRALQLDHIRGGGSLETKLRGGNQYRQAKRDGFPPIYQVLCANCNWIKRHEERETTPRSKLSSRYGEFPGRYWEKHPKPDDSTRADIAHAATV